MSGNKLVHMGAMVALCAAALSIAPSAEAGMVKGLLAGAVGGAVAHKAQGAMAKRKEAKAQQAARDAAEGKAPAPSAMGKEFDDTLKARMGKIKAENQAAKEASGQAGAPTFRQTLGERLKAARAAQAAEVARGPKNGL